MAASIEIQNVGKQFGTKQILRNINLDVQAGEFLTLVGPSGCGKSTLLRIIAGLTTHQNGRILMDGRDITRAAPRERNVAMVFQSYALYPHMSVAKNIATPLNMRQLPTMARLPLMGRFWPGQAEAKQRIREAVNTAASQVQIEQLLHHKPSELSGGQRQRVAVARALVRQPGAFLMDEPLSNLDARLRVHMRTELSALHQRLGSTFIYVTHDQVEAMTLSSRVAVMMDGEITQVGTPRELYSRPDNIKVARFIGSPEMNILPVDRDNGGNLWVAGQRLTIDERSSQNVVQVGIRAEQWHLAPGVTHPIGQGLSIGLRVTRTEVLGHDVLLFGHIDTVGETPIVARITLEQLDRYKSAGHSMQKVRLTVDRSALLAFDKSGNRCDVTQETARYEQRAVA